MSALDARLRTALADRYRVERELGAGGMATVYLAEDLKHHRQVALKVLRPDLAHAVGPERFLREIETTAQLHHPHILPLYDSGTADGFLYYVMPFVEGETLRDRLAREKQLPIDDALLIAREVSDALSYAHSRGVIHRDIKPENILLEGGHAMVADFGIARAVSVSNESITQTGTSVGTPAYMSPEQAAGSQDLDGRSDLYSLGCVVYEMLAGQAPFTGPTVESIVHQHMVADPRPITQLRPAVPPAIAGVLQRALAKNPADRFSPVAQFAEALRTGGSSTRVSPPEARARPRWPMFAGLGAALVGAALVIGFIVRRERSAAPGAESSTPSVAVLPFVDLSGGANEYLADGMAETLINAMSSLPGLHVAARTSAFSFKGKNEDVRTIGQALGVGAVLEGSIQRAGDQLRVTAQLINAKDGFHLWSQNFDRKATDVFAVQDEVARAVVSALKVKLVGNNGDHVVEQGTRNLDAYNAYLQGLFFWNKRTAADLKRAAEFFQQAITADSTYAKAWAGLSMTYVLFIPAEYNVRGVSPAVALERAEQAARRALALDDRSVEAHTGLAKALESRGQLAESGVEYERAIAIEPRFATARQWYSDHLMNLGLLDSALAQMRLAQGLDPLSLVISVEAGEVLDVVGRRGDATTQYERVIERYPDAYLTHFFASVHFLVGRDFERAAGLLGAFAMDLGYDSATARGLADGIRNPSTRDRTLRTLAGNLINPDLRIAAYRALGDDDGAIGEFERLVNDPALDALRERLYPENVRATLGPKLFARPRARAAFDTYFARLRTPRR